MLKIIFEMTGMEVTTAINGYEAFQFICNSEEDFDLVALDLHMPISDGYETCRNIIKHFNSEKIFQFDD